VFLTLLCASAVAQPTLSLNDAIKLTLAQHPQLGKYAYQAQASQSLIRQASVSTPMSIEVEIEDAMGTDSYSGVSSMQTTLGISWLLEDSVIDARVKVANEKAAVSDFSREVQVLDLAAETAGLYVTLLSQQQLLKLARQDQLQSQQALDEITKRVNAAQSSAVDQLRAKAALSKKSLLVEDLIHEIEASRSQLAAQWRGEADFQINGTLNTIPAIDTLDKAYDKLKTNPRLKIFATQQRIAQSQIGLARATENPSWKISAGIKRNEAIDDFGFGVGVSIPFGSENRHADKISALQAQQNEQQARADAWYQRLSTQLLILTHKLKHNRHVIEGLSGETIPTLEQAAIKAGQAYRIGSYSYTDWFAVKQELLQAQTELVETYKNIHLNNIELERLTGASIANQAR
jgi:cobalt-zinc-cadmium efflux system outer membrane protein